MPRILIIDDDHQFRKMLRITLERMGHEVVEAANGQEGLAAYHSGQTDLIITDLIMPEKEGIETIMELRQLNPRPKIIAMSGGGRFKARDLLPAAKGLGAVATLAKPFTNQQLAAAIDAALKLQGG